MQQSLERIRHRGYGYCFESGEPTDIEGDRSECVSPHYAENILPLLSFYRRKFKDGCV